MMKLACILFIFREFYIKIYFLNSKQYLFKEIKILFISFHSQQYLFWFGEKKLKNRILAFQANSYLKSLLNR